jgi:hypothetical protein
MKKPRLTQFGFISIGGSHMLVDRLPKHKPRRFSSRFMENVGRRANHFRPICADDLNWFLFGDREPMFQVRLDGTVKMSVPTQISPTHWQIGNWIICGHHSLKVPSVSPKHLTYRECWACEQVRLSEERQPQYRKGFEPNANA